MRVLIRGAGVAGLTTAFELMRRGASVTVAERQDRAGGMASWYAGGMLAPWCERENADQKVLELGIKATDWWESVLPSHVERMGTLVVAAGRDRAELDRFASRTSGYEKISAGEIGDLEPDLSGRFRNGLFFAEEAHMDPRAAMLTLWRQLENGGVAFRFGDDGSCAEEFDCEIDCTGMASEATGLRGVRGEMLLMRVQGITLSRPVRLLHPRIPVYVVPRGDGLFMVGATMVESEADGSVTARSLMELLNAAYALHPAFGEAEVVEIGVGVRPAYPDNFPRVTGHNDVIRLNGLYRHGFLLAPVLAQEAAQQAMARGGMSGG
ncbi:glycine oxidase ThiO [Hoeflea sp. TYP-13]|uniref:glycine oxidase ThiO n=1 Tax=Hoeflea sp. TYP-13 TaxID=3230023 RepID=UPI0034C6795D